jgi:hypothetical protein
MFLEYSLSLNYKKFSLYTQFRASRFKKARFKTKESYYDLVINSILLEIRNQYKSN